MTGTTPKGFPYVQPTDNVTDYPVTSLALANKLEAVVPAAIAAGPISMSIASGVTTGNAAVTFPAGRFSQPPVAVATLVNSSTYGFYAVIQGLATTTGMTVGVISRDAATGMPSTSTVTAHWIAVQMLTTAGPGVEVADLAGVLEVTCTCRTEGCGNEGIAIPLYVPVDDPPDVYVCGVCGQEITERAVTG